MPIAEETFVDPIAVMDPSGGVDNVNTTVTPPLLLRAMMESFVTTQVGHG